MLRRISCVIAVLGLALGSGSASASVLDLTTGVNLVFNGNAAALGGTFDLETTNVQTTGTGVIDPFLRLQAQGNNTSEQGFNHSAGSIQMDEKPPLGGFTKDLLVSAVGTVQRGGVDYLQFLLDINQNTAGNDRYLSLNQIQIFGAASAPTAAAVNAAVAPPAAAPVFGGVGGTELFRMSNFPGTPTTEIKLDYSLNPGSGSGDMFLFVRKSLFVGFTNIIFYSQFGVVPGSFGTNDGIEEWSIAGTRGPLPCVDCDVTPIPEPASLLVFGVGLVAAASRVRRRR